MDSDLKTQRARRLTAVLTLVSIALRIVSLVPSIKWFDGSLPGFELHTKNVISASLWEVCYAQHDDDWYYLRTYCSRDLNLGASIALTILATVLATACFVPLYRKSRPFAIALSVAAMVSGFSGVGAWLKFFFSTWTPHGKRFGPGPALAITASCLDLVGAILVWRLSPAVDSFWPCPVTLARFSNTQAQLAGRMAKPLRVRMALLLLPTVVLRVVALLPSLAWFSGSWVYGSYSGSLWTSCQPNVYRYSSCESTDRSARAAAGCLIGAAPFSMLCWVTLLLNYRLHTIIGNVAAGHRGNQHLGPRSRKFNTKLLRL
eukprot:m.162752 g.162752  ORF g.162752 m.162752 type:complete len:317 (-) comp53063_c0_seq23:632-1582(-)